MRRVIGVFLAVVFVSLSFHTLAFAKTQHHEDMLHSAKMSMEECTHLEETCHSKQCAYHHIMHLPLVAPDNTHVFFESLQSKPLPSRIFQTGVLVPNACFRPPSF